MDQARVHNYLHFSTWVGVSLKAKLSVWHKRMGSIREREMRVISTEGSNFEQLTFGVAGTM